jgi:alkylation response protein AidB-like acyl-CoA dehydrogenase
MYPGLTSGAADLIVSFGTAAQRELFCANMIQGRWSGTMCLTEPHAGSDVGDCKTAAVPNGDGTYRIKGTKIFISGGDHDLSDNIVHMVLARIDGAPKGTKGLSLFIVPKIRVNADGSLGQPNDVTTASIEHKMGIRASSTCVLNFGEDDACQGLLCGSVEHQGIAQMFQMMNRARSLVGVQGVAAGSAAYLSALEYARERKQGAAASAGRDPEAPRVPIIEHPDVRRMLLDMRAQTAAARAVCFETARALDLAKHGRDDAERRANADLAALLTPVAKAFSTDIGTIVASLGIQVHGGMGYIEETGAAQHLRDARICQIYEGTNGIQAIDLVTRKLPLADGNAVRDYTARIRAEAEAMAQSGDGDAAAIGVRLAAAVTALEDATGYLQSWLKDGGDRPLASATPYLRLFGLTAGAAGLARGARAAMARRTRANDDQRLRLARYFADNHLPYAGALKSIVECGPDSLLATTPDMLAL